MEELFRYTMTEEDFRENADALARCEGSRTRTIMLTQQRNLCILVAVLLAMLWLLGVVRGDAFWIALAASVIMLWLLRLFAVPWFVGQQMRVLRYQKKKAEREKAPADRDHRIFLRDGKYVHQIGQQVVDAIPLASLREVKPAGKGGPALLFDTGMDDYLPVRLFKTADAIPEFCARMNALAEAARQTPPAESKPALEAADTAADTAAIEAGEPASEAGKPASVTGEAAEKRRTPRPVYTFRYTLEGQQAVRLFAAGNARLCFLPQRWKNYQRSLILIALVLALEWVFIGPVGALCVALLPAAALLGPALPPVSQAIYRRRLRSGRLDSMLGEHQVDFYDDSVVIRRKSGEYEQKYGLFLKLMDTPEGWFLVGKTASTMLPLPKASLPEGQHAAFAAFVEQKLGAAS